MAKYPLDDQALQEITQDIVGHHRGQQATIVKLQTLLQDAVDLCEDEEQDWYSEASIFLKDMKLRTLSFENHRFDQKNGHKIGLRSPFAQEIGERVGHIDIEKEAELNAMEAEGFGEEMNEAEIARLFKVEEPKKKKVKQKKLSRMTLEEIEEWEKAQDNSNDIYKVSARIKNLARGAVKSNLTAQGDMVINMFTHVIKTLYDFADTVSDKETKIRLTETIRRQEEMPANLIAALGAGVKAAK
jgi:hypothetical protein